VVCFFSCVCEGGPFGCGCVFMLTLYVCFLRFWLWFWWFGWETIVVQSVCDCRCFCLEVIALYVVCVQSIIEAPCGGVFVLVGVV
jgi:hypothetical protein